MKINLKATRKKLIAAREAEAGDAVLTKPISDAIVLFEGGYNAQAFRKLDDAAQRKRDGGFVMANHWQKPWVYTACDRSVFQ